MADGKRCVVTVSLRMREVQSPIIPIVGELIRANPGTISLGQGVVHYGPPAEAIGQLPAFLENVENHKYQLVGGIAPLREAIIEKLRAENAIELGADSALCVTAGGNMAFMNAVLAITDPGDEVMLLTPYYFNHEMAVRIAGCRPIGAATDEQYQPDLGAIRAAITPRTRAVVTISPNNPTGAVYPESALRAINALCREYGLYHINDEAYEYFTYDGARHFSPGAIAGAAGHTVSLFSLSKAYGFASWRIGYMVFPQRLEVAVKKIQDTILICPPVVSQYAAVGALRVGAAYCRARLEAYDEVRRFFVRSFEPLAPFCTVPRAQGAFYFLIKVATELAAMDLVERLVREHKVAVIPGDTFGIEDGCYLRVSYGALRKETAVEGIGRLVAGLERIVGS
jgi:aspartate/methionine/tyrosine aminotransferase